MANTWLIADNHFRHKNILNFENRPFESIEQMEDGMVKSWNSVVGKNDTVYVLGDFCFGGHQAWIEVLDQLKGDVILIKGNHDKTKVINRVKREGYLKEIHEVGTILRAEKFILNLTHYPLGIGERPFNFSIHGHIHSNPSQYVNQINVGVDSLFMESYYDNIGVPFGTPVNLEYLIDWVDYINKYSIIPNYTKGN